MMSNSNQQRLDGVTVESHGGRFAGTFDLDEDVVEDLAFGEVVYALVIANTQPPVFKTDSNNDLKRIEVFAAEDVRIIPRSVWDEVLDIIEANAPQQRLFARLAAPDYSRVQQTDGLGNASDVDLTNADGAVPMIVPEPVVDEETGEILSAEPSHASRPVPAHILERRRRRESEVEGAAVPVGTRVAGQARPAGSQDPLLRQFMEQDQSHG